MAILANVTEARVTWKEGIFTENKQCLYNIGLQTILWDIFLAND